MRAILVPHAEGLLGLVPWVEYSINREAFPDAHSLRGFRILPNSLMPATSLV